MNGSARLCVWISTGACRRREGSFDLEVLWVSGNALSTTRSKSPAMGCEAAPAWLSETWI
jgi:hypothetical protein